MKVLHIETGRHLYGGPLQVVHLLRGLREHPGTHILVCPPGSAIANHLGGSPQQIKALPMRGELDVAMVPRLAWLMRKERPDLVHIHSRRGADLWGGIAARMAGIPAVLSRRVDNPEPHWFVPWKYRLYRHVITISEGIRRVLLSEGLPASHLTCVPSSVDTDLFRPDGDRCWLEQEFGIASDERVIAMAAQFIPRKGHEVLLLALPTVLERHPRTRVLLLGQGPLHQSVRAACRERGLDDNVAFPGFRNDLPRILPAIDLLVHPAFMEGLGVILLQAASCAIPIVACRAGGIPEIVEDGKNGYLLDPGDHCALADRLCRVLSDAGRARRLGQSGRQMALERFSIPSMVEGTLGVYRDVLGIA